MSLILTNIAITLITRSFNNLHTFAERVVVMAKRAIVEPSAAGTEGTETWVVNG